MTATSPQACAADFTAALLARDIDAALALVADEIVFFFSNGTTVVGKDAFAKTMTAAWSVIENYKYESGGSDWITRADTTAAVIYSFAWSGVARGQNVSGAGRGTRIFARQPDGRWLMTHEHISNGQWKG
ncbi:MAG TPA: nuclear transport factor 2 family protein [Hyphomonadaceae bacterium]|nr:nuclear transport factor 2 family protein [Hyphomonadaceae bacterium]